MKKYAVVIMIIAILSKGLGFIREIILSYYYGASNVTDAYLIAQTIPVVMFGFVGTGIATSFIPMYRMIEVKCSKDESYKYLNNVINILLIICTIIIFICLLFSRQIVKLFASGFDAKTLALAVDFTRISLWSIYFTGISAILRSFLQINNNFYIPELIGIPFSLVTISCIIFSSKNNVMLLAYGLLIASAAQFLLIVPYLKRYHYTYGFYIDIKSEHIINMANIALPVILGVSVNQINLLVDRTLASNISVGGISALNYAGQLNGFVQGIFVLSIVTVLYPMISKMTAENDNNGLKKIISEALIGIIILVLPFTIGTMIFSKPIVEFLFARGAFSIDARTMTSGALFYYSIGMIGFGVRELLSRVFYSLQDTKTPMMNAVISMLLNIILNIILSQVMGLAGLALATSISAVFCAGLLFIQLRKKIGPFGMKNISIVFLKILFASLVMGVITKLSYNTLLDFRSDNISLCIAIIFGALSYFIIVCFMKIEDVDIIVNTIKMKILKTIHRV